MKLFASKFTVEQIHAEIDSAQDRLIQQAEKLISELNIPTETQVERKADQLEKLGFVNSETVKKAESLKNQRKEVELKVVSTKEQAELLRYYKQTYPLQKFLTVEELDRICEKYGLIHAPVSNYVKDVPEKNVLEMAKVCKLKDSDLQKIKHFMEIADWWWDLPDRIKKAIPKRFEVNTNNLLIDREVREMFGLTEYGGCIYRTAKIETVDKSGLFIAAPPSHFDTSGLTKKGKFGFFKVTTIEVKDPIVFEYCRGGFVRVITKWGTEDDQSYLDPSLVNEILN
jgi:hypothetical protein